MGVRLSVCKPVVNHTNSFAFNILLTVYKFTT